MLISTGWCVISLFLVASMVLRAQDPNASQADLIRTLLARIDKLEKRVSELESKTAPPLETRSVPAESPAVHDHEAPPSSGSAPNLRIAGFSDINFGATDQRG